jgi:hypothetical protein
MLDRRELAMVVFNDWKESQRATFEVAAGWGRWLIGSLVIVHGGALFGMFSFLDGVAADQVLLTGYKWPIWCFVLGLVLALLSGFFAWINWSMHSYNYGHQAHHEMLWNPNEWLKDAYFDRGLTVTNRLSIGSGLCSAFLIVAATAMLLHGSQILPWLGPS